MLDVYSSMACRKILQNLIINKKIKKIPCLIVIVDDVAPALGGDNSTGLGTDVLPPPLPFRGGVMCKGVSCCCGGGELFVVDPTDPGSLYPPAVLLSSGVVSKKHKLNSVPASKVTSEAFILSGEGALPMLPLSDWSILKTSIVFRYVLPPECAADGH